MNFPAAPDAILRGHKSTPRDANHRGHDTEGSDPSMCAESSKSCCRCGSNSGFAIGSRHCFTCNLSLTLAERIQSRSRPDASGCRLWVGSADAKGYGQIWSPDRGRAVEAYRLNYELCVGPVPEGHELHHRCETPACVNPEHLVPLTRDQHARFNAQAQQTHCVHGHEYTPENTYIRSDGKRRDCRACGKKRTAAYLARKKAA